MFFQIDIFKNCAVFTGKHLWQSLFLINLQACNLIQKETFPVNIAKFLKTTFFIQNTSLVAASVATNKQM